MKLKVPWVFCSESFHFRFDGYYVAYIKMKSLSISSLAQFAFGTFRHETGDLPGAKLPLPQALGTLKTI